jgi:uncharacterized protein (TIGR00299 family) protein
VRIAYVDCICGISGDMTLAALIDLGVPPEAIEGPLRELPLEGWELIVERTAKQGIAATRVKVTSGSHPHHGGQSSASSAPVHGRPFSEIADMIGASALDDAVKKRSIGIFRRVAEAEARIHNTTPEEVHFHELGGIDSIVDIVGAVIGFRTLGVEAIHCSPVPMSHGHIQCAHGTLPVPAPATLEMARGLPVRPLDVEGETVTPTGIAIVAALADRFGPWPAMTVERVGYGAGAADFEPIPNVLRIAVGQAEPELNGLRDTVRLIEANIDDMNPELYEAVFEQLFAHGALDVWLTPIQMKKSRPAVQLSVLCHPPEEAVVVQAVFRHTTTFGVRVAGLSRFCLPREHIEVETPYGRIRIKVARLRGEVVTRAPEYADCKRAAQEHGVPLGEVYAAALEAR